MRRSCGCVHVRSNPYSISCCKSSFRRRWLRLLRAGNTGLDGGHVSADNSHDVRNRFHYQRSRSRPWIHGESYLLSEAPIRDHRAFLDNTLGCQVCLPVFLSPDLEGSTGSNALVASVGLLHGSYVPECVGHSASVVSTNLALLRAW